MTGANGAPLHVALLHNYRDEQQPSMRLYADRLGDALIRKQVAVTRVHAPGIVPEAWRRRSAVWGKVDGYAGRFVVYPRLLPTVHGDIVHVVDHGQGYLLGGLNPKNTVVTCHDVILLALASGRIGGAQIPQVALQLFRISLQFVRRAARVIADSHQTKQDLVDFTGVEPNKVDVVYPGLNQRFAPNPEARLELRQQLAVGNSLLVLQIGRAFYKNILGVLRVIAKLREQGIDARLVRVGRALFGEELVLAERLRLRDSVIELGSVPDERLPVVYNAVDLLLFPSLYEGFGWPPLEAMASGTPVVCSRAGSLNEVVGTAALTADPEDIEALVWHAGAALTDEDLRRTLVARGLARAAEFSWDRTAEQTLAIYRRVLDEAA